MAQAGIRGVTHLAQLVREQHPGVAASQPTISRLLAGQVKLVQPALLRAVAETLEVSVEELFAILYPIEPNGGAPPSDSDKGTQRSSWSAHRAA